MHDACAFQAVPNPKTVAEFVCRDLQRALRETAAGRYSEARQSNDDKTSRHFGLAKDEIQTGCVNVRIDYADDPIGVLYVVMLEFTEKCTAKILIARTIEGLRG